MSIYISTNLYQANEFEKIFTILKLLDDPTVGIEIFPLWHDPEFEGVLKQNLARLKEVPICFHGPYYFTEHSEPKGSLMYQRARDYYQKTFEYAKELNCKYIVFHHNNCPVIPEKRGEMVLNAGANLQELNELAKAYQIMNLVENAGTIHSQNMLFDEEQFISIFEEIDNQCLIDIGHAHCNGWDLENVIKRLGPKIVGYHLHNNYGTLDEHNRINDGTLDIDAFFKAYRRFTPNADLVLEYSSKLNRDIEGICEDVRGG